MPLTDRLAAVFEKVFDLDPSDFSEKLVPEDVLRWDSLGHMSMVMELEEKFEIEIPEEDLESIKTVGDLVAHIEAKLAEK